MDRPKHSRASVFVGQGLFDNLKSFSELETRISTLQTPLDRGLAFEVFAEAYLATQAISQARQVWPFDSIPLSVREKLALNTGGKDMGVDGVYETHLGQFNAYQVKFRSERVPLVWDELSTFMGLADQVAQRVVFTNANDFPSLMKQRHGFFPIRGSDLDRLEEREFEEVVTWLRGCLVREVKKRPRPHQQSALADILRELEQHNRVTAIMACGTGKTLVALWAAEQLGCRNVLVLVPSLALLRQTLHEWLKETAWNDMAYLCVCSDQTVEKGVDAIRVQQSDLDFPVTTDSETVKAFLAAKFVGAKVVFSTYQSASVVGEAMDAETTFDLGVFDEAHKTAGREGRNLCYALDDKNIRITKRLFLTATPRHYNPHEKTQGGESKLVFSMDNPAIYGPIAHTLTFARAAAQGIICNYKVIISVVTSEMVTSELLRRGEVIVKGDAVKAQQVANQIVLRDMAEKHGVRKVFTFHKSVESARSFTSNGPEGLKAHLPRFDTYHVNGEMRTADREDIMSAFRASERAVISNARCLTEGVDVPAVDMVAFLSPRRSRVDIVQATGRAMRAAPKKTTGYVFVPLYVEPATGESLEEAVSKSDNDEIWDVLQSLQEQDEALADIIREMSEEHGKARGFDDTRFCEKIEVLGPVVSLESLRKSLAAQCIEHIGNSWDHFFGQLLAYKARHGDCSVPVRFAEDPTFGNWVWTQRQKLRKGLLSDERIRRLNDIGFSPHVIDAKWWHMLSAFCEHKKKLGLEKDCAENPDLHKWVKRQRNYRSRGLLSEDQVRRLSQEGFIWDWQEYKWNYMFEKLRKYKEIHGNCDVPLACDEDRKFGQWTNNQRFSLKHGGLSTERAKKLIELGLGAIRLERGTWESRYEELKEFKRIHGHCNVQQNDPNNPRLGNWVNNQRSRRKKQVLDAAKIKRLDELGFVWNS